jgi:hypothetical protein
MPSVSSLLKSPALRSNLRQIGGAAAGYGATGFTAPVLESMLPGEEKLNAPATVTERLVNMGLGAYLARPGTFSKQPNLAKLLSTKGLLFAAPVGIHHGTEILGKTSDTFKGINKLTETANTQVEQSGKAFGEAAKAIKGTADQTLDESVSRQDDTSKLVNSAIGSVNNISASLSNMPKRLDEAAASTAENVSSKISEGWGAAKPALTTAGLGAGGALLGNLAASATSSTNPKDEAKNRRRRALWTLLGLGGGAAAGYYGSKGGTPAAAPAAPAAPQISGITKLMFPGIAR